MTTFFKIIALFIISVCILSCNEYGITESIVVTYFPGYHDFYKKVVPPVFEEAIDEPSDTLYISREIYTKLKEYASSQDANNHSNNVDVRLLMTIDTTKSYFGMIPYGYNPSDKVQEMEYLIKSISHYYNFFSRDDLTIYCQEVNKYGIPKEYHYIDRSKFQVKKEYYRCLLLVK